MTATADRQRTRRIVPVQTELSIEHDLVFASASDLADQLRQEAATLGDGPCWLLAWLDDAVLLGTVTSASVQAQRPIDPAILVELRLFSPAGEWRLWRTGEHFAARRRTDGRGETLDVLEDDQSLWGTAATTEADGWTMVTEARGVSLALPHHVGEGDLPFRLRLRHYLADDDDGMVGVADSRLVALCTWSGEPLRWEEATDV